jgi:hypothetical protein
VSVDASVLQDPARSPRDAAGIATTLESAFTLLLKKAMRDTPFPSLRPGGIDFWWGGGGLPLSVLTIDPLIAEVPFASRLVWAHLFAGDATGAAVSVDATIELQLTNLYSFGVKSPVYGGGIPPALIGAYAADLDISDWQVNFNVGDVLIAYPTIFTGTATWLALTLQLRPTDVPQGIDTVTDNAGSDMTFNDGSGVEFRA